MLDPPKGWVDYFGLVWTSLEPFWCIVDHFAPYWTIMNHYGPFRILRQFWTILTNFKISRTILDLLGQLVTILGNFKTFLTPQGCLSDVQGKGLQKNIFSLLFRIFHKT